jgi:hypothetical protein
VALAVLVLVGPLARPPEGGATSFEGASAAGERHEHGECLLVLVRLELAAWLGLGLGLAAWLGLGLGLAAWLGLGLGLAAWLG